MSAEFEIKGNNNQEYDANAKKKKIARWVVGVFFLLGSLVYLLSFASIFFIIAAILILPIPALEKWLLKLKINNKIAIVLSVVIFCIGSLLVPATEPVADDSNNQSNIGESSEDNDTIPENNISDNSGISDTVVPDNSDPNDNIETPDNNDVDTNKPDDTSKNEEKVQMVWISSNGSKYHSKSSCSGMKSPRQITIEEAKNQGYEPCKKCH